MEQWLSTQHPDARGFTYRDVATGLLHGHVRWPDGQPPTPFGCRWRGEQQHHHGRQYLRGKAMHSWARPTDEQILARMRARRKARGCRCHLPFVDPYAYTCEADDCEWRPSELNPFGGSTRPVNEPSAKVRRVCGCGWSTSTWHVDDGSADVELNRHVRRAHGGVYPPLKGGA
jgi:hypothetical protein